jgi:hypothetical protein
MGIGFDSGTYNLVCCTRDDKGKDVYKREVNAFIEIPLDNPFLFNIMDESGKVPLINRGDMAFALGEAALNMAVTLDLDLKRPMKDGCVNPAEKDAFEILNLMIHSMIDEIEADGVPLYFSVPANAVNEQTDADYHRHILQGIFDAYESSRGYKVRARPLNEGLALIYAELQSKAYSGIGISFGAGMVNLCCATHGVPAFQFALVNSGDWIDKQVAKATGESVAYVNKQKENVDLGKTPTSLGDRAIRGQYQIMVEKTIQGIKKGLAESGKKIRQDNPIDVVIAGGTAMPTGFDTLFKETLLAAKLPLKVGSIIKPKEPLYSVARGCLIAAEKSQQG